MIFAANGYNYKNNNNMNENINHNKFNNFECKKNSVFYVPNNTYASLLINRYKNNNINEEIVELECVCDNYNYTSKKDIIQCILCSKYQHLSCIYQAQYTQPYLCFNSQFKKNHFYL